MDYFQGVVTEYLRADRTVFVNTECLIQLDAGDAPGKGRHWYCDAVAVNFRERVVYLCEVTYSTTLYSLILRLQAWTNNWSALCAAIARDCAVSSSWRIQPWIFIPKARQVTLERKLQAITHAVPDDSRMPTPKVTFLEDVAPWKYRNWDRKVEALEADGHDEKQ